MNTYPRELARGFWLVGDACTNLYLIRGRNGWALLEAGISAGVDEAIRQIDALGAVPDFIVVLHPHADHVTGLPGLRERFPAAAVLAGRGTPEFLSHPRAASAAIAEDRQLWEYYNAAGLTPGRPPLSELPSLEGCQIVEDGEEIALGGQTLRFLSVGGHSPGQLAVHLPEIGGLVVSDALGFYFRGRGFFPTFFTSLQEHLATLDRLEALTPRVLALGHMGALLGDEALGALREARVAALRLLARVRANRHRIDALAEELFREAYVGEFRMYSEGNIRNCVRLTIRRCLEAERADHPSPPPSPRA